MSIVSVGVEFFKYEFNFEMPEELIDFGVKNMLKIKTNPFCI